MLGGLSLLFAAPAAEAHATLVATIPQAGYGVAEPPKEIGLVFDESVRPGPRGIAVEGQARGDIETTRARMTGKGRITVRPLRPLPEGRYTVRWQVLGEDGHTVEGSYGFGVGRSAPQAGRSGGTSTPGLPAASVFRWLVFAGLCLALGGLAGERLVRDRIAHAPPERALSAPRALTGPGAVIGAVGAAGLGLHQLGAGDVLSGVGGFSPAELLGSRPGVWVGIEFVAFLVAGLAAGRRRRRVAILALLVAVTGEAARNHLGTAEGPVGVFVMAVHLLAAALWVGALVHVVRTTLGWRETPGQAWALVRMYAVGALIVYAIVVLTGTIAAILLVPSLEDLVASGYGRLLLVKIALVALATGIAVAARAHVRRPTAGQPLQTLARAEGAALAAVLGVTAVLTSLGAPPDTSPALAYPDPVRGPAIRLGTLAGQVTTSIVASEGQLEVRLRTPEYDPSAQQPYQLRGTLTGPSGRRERLALRPCGSGCYVSPAGWRPGRSTVALRVDAQGWHGGNARFRVPWPVRERPELLDRVLRTMARRDSVAFEETVTSDTSRPAPLSSTLRMSGPGLLDSEPYRSGVVGTVAELRRHGDAVEIAFAITAQDYYVRLVVGPGGRLIRERITAPSHVIWHDFGYPTR
ncbi:MAG: copper resistance CopC/CopD family protein [Streptomycetales bacterium]